MKYSQSNFQSILITVTLLPFLTNSVQAQIVPDRTLPNNSKIDRNC